MAHQIYDYHNAAKSWHPAKQFDASKQNLDSAYSYHYRQSDVRPYDFTILTRPHQSPPPYNVINHRISDFAPSSLASLVDAFHNQDVVISTIAPADVSYQKCLIDAAIVAKVRHFVLCEFSYDTQNETVRKVFPPAEAKWEVLNYLRQRTRNIDTEEDGFGWTGLATGCLLEKGLLDGLPGFDLTWRTATVYGSGDARFPCSTLDGVGKVITEILEDWPKGPRPKGHIYKHGFMTSQNEILSALEKTDSKKWDVVNADVDECVREGERRMEKGFFDGAMMLLEPNVLFGELGDLGIWEEHKAKDLQQRRDKLDVAVRKALEQMERTGKPDCGCG